MQLGNKGYFTIAGNTLRTQGVGLQQYGRATLRLGNTAYGSQLAFRSQYFRPTGRASFRPHVPGAEKHVRETLTYHFAWLGGSNGLTVKDAVAKDSWSLRMACTPKLKRESDNRYTAQVACYGRLGWSAQQLPVVVQFTLLGNQASWKIHGQPTIVSANRIARPGHSVMANVWAEEGVPSAVDSPVEAAEATQVTE